MGDVLQDDVFPGILPRHVFRDRKRHDFSGFQMIVTSVPGEQRDIFVEIQHHIVIVRVHMMRRWRVDQRDAHVQQRVGRIEPHFDHFR